ncbi:MAG: hypothetical protein AAGI48_16930 [Verrucomicrobiota bacterium]
MKEEPQEWEESEAITKREPDAAPQRKGSRVNKLVMTLVAALLIVIIAGLSAPMVLRCRVATERTQTINNAKQVGLALLEFDQEFGSFPDNSTAPMVRAAIEGDTKLTLSGTSSNAMFRQLIAYGVGSEDIFFVPDHPECSKKPDGNMRPGKALEAGENGWSYIMLDVDTGQNTSGNPGRPVLAAPMRIGTDQFWSEPFGDKGIILRLDNSVEVPIIRKDGRLSVGNGKTLFDTGEERVWGPVSPVILHPEPGG